MSGQERLYILALIISIFVIIGITTIFSLLFFLYSLYKVKNISRGDEDKSLKEEFDKSYFKKNKRKLTKLDFYKKEKKKDRIFHGVVDTFIGTVIVGFLFIFLVGLSFSVTDNNVSIYGNTYITILSPSMEEKNEKNTYLEENHLDNQILQYSLISIKSVEKKEDIKLYDIVAIRLKESEVSETLIEQTNSFSLLEDNSNSEEDNIDNYIILVHRVIDIYEGDEDVDVKTEEGKTYFTTRGDSNSASFDEEKQIPFESIIGVYTGFNSYYAGVFIIYFKSSIGIIAILSAALFLFLAAISEEKITKSYDKRNLYLIELESPLLIEEVKKIEYKDKEDEDEEIS